ncbi:MAG: anti-sigma regulatory factor [Desulfamplus sp.]|nr:anti-sigma regulatory factor [Desulfamplus sp.]
MTMNKIIEETTIDVCEPSDNAAVIYTTRQMSAQIGFNEAEQFLIAAAASELSTNIIRYAKKGVVVLRFIKKIISEQESSINITGIEITAKDSGCGISNVDQAMQEHFSTGNSLGLGLPSVKRIMDEFFIESSPENGTVVIATKWRE